MIYDRHQIIASRYWWWLIIIMINSRKENPQNNKIHPHIQNKTYSKWNEGKWIVQSDKFLSYLISNIHASILTHTHTETNEHMNTWTFTPNIYKYIYKSIVIAHPTKIASRTWETASRYTYMLCKCVWMCIHQTPWLDDTCNNEFKKKQNTLTH